MSIPADRQSPPLEIGSRLASHRIRRGITVSALARELGVSPSLISQIERGQSRPSVSTLLGLAEALDLPVDAFFRDDPALAAGADGQPSAAAGAGAAGNGAAARPRPPARARLHGGGGQFVRAGQRDAIAIEGGVRWERLTPTQLHDVEFMELVYGPGAQSHATQYRHPGMEMVLVLEGRLDIHVGSEHYEMEPGDSLWFPSTDLHRYVNPTEQTTRAVTVILPDWEPAEPPDTDRRP